MVVITIIDIPKNFSSQSKSWLQTLSLNLVSIIRNSWEWEDAKISMFRTDHANTYYKSSNVMYTQIYIIFQPYILKCEMKDK